MSELPQNSWLGFLSDPNEATFGPIYDQTQALVWTLCLQILIDSDDAADAFQSAWCRFLAETQVRMGTASRHPEDCEQILRRLLYRVTVREAQNLRGRRSRLAKRKLTMESLHSIPGDEPSAEDRVARQQIRVQVEALVRLLPEEVQTPLRLHYFHGLSQAEIAQMLGLNQGTISRRTAKGLIQLKKYMLKAGLGGALQELAAFLLS